MILPENDYQILKLSSAFYNDYPNPPHVELLDKPLRRYNCLLFQSHYDYFICVPFRSNVNHRFAYHFKYSKRSMLSKSALDYTKIVIISDLKYLETKTSYIDKDEYIETLRNFNEIKQSALKYVDDYVSHIKGISIIKPVDFSRKYGKSTLKYFHDILLSE